MSIREFTEADFNVYGFISFYGWLSCLCIMKEKNLEFHFYNTFSYLLAGVSRTYGTSDGVDNACLVVICLYSAK